MIPFDIIKDMGSNVPFMGILTSSSTFVLKLTGSRRTLIETITSDDQIFEGNDTSPTPYLP